MKGEAHKHFRCASRASPFIRNGNDFIHMGTTLFTWERLYLSSTTPVKDPTPATPPTPPSPTSPNSSADPHCTPAPPLHDTRTTATESPPAEGSAPRASPAHTTHHQHAAVYSHHPPSQPQSHAHHEHEPPGCCSPPSRTRGRPSPQPPAAYRDRAVR